MDERGISGRALARKVPCDQALVSRYLTGKQEPSTKMAQLFDDALGAEGALVGLAKPGRRAVLTGGLVAGALMTISPETLERLAWAERHPPQGSKLAGMPGSATPPQPNTSSARPRS